MFVIRIISFSSYYIIISILKLQGSTVTVSSNLFVYYAVKFVEQINIYSLFQAMIQR